MEQTTQNTPVSPQADTHAEVLYQPESSLPAAPAVQVAHLRALNTAGESVNITLTTLREMTGIDYSKLEEQIVPGEFRLNFAGAKMQVYTRTFVLKNVLIKEEAGIGRTAVKLMSGSQVKEIVGLDGVLDLGQTKRARYIQGIEGIFTNVHSDRGEVDFIFRALTLNDVGKLFDATITIKYIK